MTSASARILDDASVRERVYAHAMAWFPKECCGLLVLRDDQPDAVCADNQLDEAHAREPERFPRTAEDGYLLDARLIEAPAEPYEVVAIFHSHVRVGAYFSEEDRQQAMAPWDEPLYPDLEHVVLDAQDEGVRGFKVFRWSEARADFVDLAGAAA